MIEARSAGSRPSTPGEPATPSATEFAAVAGPSTTDPEAPAVIASSVPAESDIASARTTMFPALAGEAAVLTTVPLFLKAPPRPPAIKVIVPPVEKTVSGPGIVRSKPAVLVPVVTTVRLPPLVPSLVASSKPRTSACWSLRKRKLLPAPVTMNASVPTALAEGSDTAPTEEMSRLLAAMVPVADCEMPPPAVRSTNEAAAVIGARIEMLPAASSVSPAVVGQASAPSVAIVMSPFCVPGAPSVVKSTLVPLLNVAATTAALTVALLAVGVTVAPVPPGGVMLLLAAAMVRFAGSSSQVPGVPFGAPASTWAAGSTERLDLPEVSTHPPSPPSGPPRARIAPAKRVAWSDHTATWPPLPRPVALASIMAPWATVVAAALRTAADRPCGPPPIHTVPPPELPRASIRAVLARVTEPPVILAEPPVWPGLAPETSIVPATLAAPPAPASIVTKPRLAPALRAVICPETSTTLPTMPPTASAVSSTVPPAASIRPLLDTRLLTGCPPASSGAAVTFGPTSNETSPSP